MANPWEPHAAPPQPWGDGQEGDDQSEGGYGGDGVGGGEQRPGDVPTIKGYETTGQGNQATDIPQPQPPPVPQGPPPQMDFGNVGTMDEAACREALLELVAENFCYGSGPAKKMKITQISPGFALHYILETFCEYRSTFYASEPYHGCTVDGPENGPAPKPWSIPCEPGAYFDDQRRIFKVPHTSSVKPCHTCHAKGWVECVWCHGRGQVRCSTCSGRGINKKYVSEVGWVDERCTRCIGTGNINCNSCRGRGTVTCTNCQGLRNLEWFIQLVVRFVTHTDDFIYEKTNLPKEMIRDVGGTLLFEQVQLPVWPITTHAVQELNDNSRALCEKHRQAYANCRQLMQRQILRGVPVTEVYYSHKSLSTRYWVYGNERRVHAPDYPAQCCWGCTVL